MMDGGGKGWTRWNVAFRVFRKTGRNVSLTGPHENSLFFFMMPLSSRSFSAIFVPTREGRTWKGVVCAISHTKDHKS